MLCPLFWMKSVVAQETNYVEKHKDEIALSPLNKNKVITIIDSLLDKNSLTPDELALLNYCGGLYKASSGESSSIALPEDFWDFDESALFNIAPLTDLPNSAELIIQNDSLGHYAHPHLGQITSKYGLRNRRMHKGIDLELTKGTPVYASFHGIVRYAQKKGNYGNVIIIRHYNGLETVYAHLSKIKVKAGELIKSGELIGLGGSTGRSSGPHLHYEVRYKGHALNPAAFISFDGGHLYGDTLLIKKSRWGIVAYPKNTSTYVIQKGDSWMEVAKRYGLSVKELCALNGTEKRYYLKQGQVLKIN